VATSALLLTPSLLRALYYTVFEISILATTASRAPSSASVQAPANFNTSPSLFRFA
jgi:hypothetical protein